MDWLSCCPPKIYVEALPPGVLNLKIGPLQRELRLNEIVRVGPSSDRRNVLRRRDSRGLRVSPERDRGKLAWGTVRWVCQPRSESAGPWILDFPSSRAGRQSVQTPSLWYFNVTAHLRRSTTTPMSTTEKDTPKGAEVCFPLKTYRCVHHRTIASHFSWINHLFALLTSWVVFSLTPVTPVGSDKYQW